MNFAMILIIAAAILGLLSMIGVASRVNLAGAGVLCLAIAALLGAGLFG